MGRCTGPPEIKVVFFAFEAERHVYNSYDAYLGVNRQTCEEWGCAVPAINVSPSDFCGAVMRNTSVDTYCARLTAFSGGGLWSPCWGGGDVDLLYGFRSFRLVLNCFSTRKVCNNMLPYSPWVPLLLSPPRSQANLCWTASQQNSLTNGLSCEGYVYPGVCLAPPPPSSEITQMSMFPMSENGIGRPREPNQGGANSTLSVTNIFLTPRCLGEDEDKQNCALITADWVCQYDGLIRPLGQPHSNVKLKCSLPSRSLCLVHPHPTQIN